MITSPLTSRGEISTTGTETHFLQTHPSDAPLKVPCSKGFIFGTLFAQITASLHYFMFKMSTLSLGFHWWLSGILADWQNSWQETGSNFQQNTLKVAVISTFRVYLQATLDLSHTIAFTCLNTQQNVCDVLEASVHWKNPNPRGLKDFNTKRSRIIKRVFLSPHF